MIKELNIKKTAIIGLIGSILLIIPNFIYLIIELTSYWYYITYVGLLRTILSIIGYIGLIIYFTTIVLRTHFKRGNIKLANYSLIGLFACSTIFSPRIINIFLLLYFISIISKKAFIPNKVFVIGMLLCSIHTFLGFSLTTLIMTIGYLMIIPYFYNYYNLIKKGGLNNGR